MARYLEGMDELSRQLGQIVWVWGMLEFSAGRLFAGLTGVEHHQQVNEFLSETSNQKRYHLLRSALQKTKVEADSTVQIRRLTNRFRNLNQTRNKFVHSSYVLGKPIEEVFIVDLRIGQKIDNQWVIGVATKLPKNDILNHCKACEKLRWEMEAMAVTLGVMPFVDGK